MRKTTAAARKRRRALASRPGQPARKRTLPSPARGRGSRQAASAKRETPLEALATAAERPAVSVAEADAPPAAEPAPRRATALFVNEPVRSGQTIEHLDGDVVVIGSVGSGAEIVAGGSIHVYGVLRGRAVAGAAGDPDARIFCQSFKAELLCIDGRYRVAENFDRSLWGNPVQARLEGQGMTLTRLD